MRRRRAILVFITGTVILVILSVQSAYLIQDEFWGVGQGGQNLTDNPSNQIGSDSTDASSVSNDSKANLSSDNYADKAKALATLDKLAVKGRAPKTGYAREQFGNGWGKTDGCSTRDIILYRDLKNTVLSDVCTVMSGTLDDPYTGKTIQFSHDNASAIQIDHVVALSDAWQTGAQQLSSETRKQLANDPLELLAVDGPANQQKGDGDAATWLPKNKAFRCEYVARQIAVKAKYLLWVTQAEKAAMNRVLGAC